METMAPVTGSPSSSRMRPVTTPPLAILTVAVAAAPAFTSTRSSEPRVTKAVGGVTLST